MVRAQKGRTLKSSIYTLIMMYNWAGSVVNRFDSLWLGTVQFLPMLIFALVVFLLGLIVAAGLGALVEKIFQTIKFDKFLSSIGLSPMFERAGLQLKGSRFLGQVVNWFLIIAFLLAVSDILGLEGLSSFLQSVLAYIPRFIAAILIMLATIVLGNFLRRVVSATVKSSKLNGADFLGSLTWWVIIVFGVLATLMQLQVAGDIIFAMIIGFIAMLSLAGGLAFGLGGKDYANHLINKLKDMERR